MKLIAQMVGRDEEGRFLDDVLQHVSSIVDEIVFTDDCSDDKTAEIAADYAHVYRMDEPTFEKDEGLLRTTAWANLENHASVGDWILGIDCDEKLFSFVPGLSMVDLLGNDRLDVVNIKFYHMWNETHYRVDKAWKPHNSYRLYRYYLGGQFKDSKLACGSEPTYIHKLIRRGGYLKNSGLAMQHLGYVRDEDKYAKYDRYMMLDGGDFHARAHLESIIDPEPTLVPWKLNNAKG